jgi:hypothetical protein
MNLSNNSFPLIISLLSLLISIYSIYIQFIEPAKLKTLVGPKILIHKQNTHISILVPVTISNISKQMGEIKRSSLIINPRESPQLNFHIQWDSFKKLNSDGNTWVQENVVSSIAVLGGATVNKNIEFNWVKISEYNSEFKKGHYNLTFLFWSQKSNPISVIRHEIYIDQKTEDYLIDPKSIGKIIELTMDFNQNENEILTLQQVKSLTTK